MGWRISAAPTATVRFSASPPPAARQRSCSRLDGTNGASPYGSLTLSGNTLYGTTSAGGAYGDGTVFSIATTGGNPTTLPSFSGSERQKPGGQFDAQRLDPVWDDERGGADGDGTIFSIATTGGAPTVLPRSAARNGANPVGEFNAQRLNPVWDDLLGRRQQRRHDLQHPHQRRRPNDAALL